MTPEPGIPSAPQPGGVVAFSRGTQPVIADYELLRQIGQGAYGDVWLARGLTGVFRAIKVVWRDRFAAAEPFEREFKGLKKFSAMTLPEASQLALLHVGQNEAAGFFYYVMELADDVESGREVDPANYTPLTLKEVRARHGRLPAAKCLAYGVELARALAGLHSRALVHRDIKPSNIILVGGVPKLADIGLVAETSEALSFVGTEGFVPPEGPGKPAADVFALGKMLYELATGLDREEFPRLPPELNQFPDRKLLFELNEVILRACEPSSEKRYHDGAALLADLLLLQAGSSVRRRGPGWLALGVAAVVILSGAIVIAVRRPAPPVPVAAATKPPAPAPAVSDKSVVVLPFENLSPDPENAFFTDGIHADIVAALSRVPDLKVITRSAALHFKDSTASLSEIAHTLGTAHVITGTVRRVGHQVRIQLDLRRAGDEQLLWSQTYDRELKDVLVLQREVAAEVARVMQARQMSGFAASAQLYTTDPEAYDLFLKALKVFFAPNGENLAAKNRSCELFTEVVQRDPKFAWAVTFLSTTHAEAWRFEDDPAKRAAHATEARHWADVAAQLDAASGDFALSFYLTRLEGEPVQGLELAERGVRLLPNDAGMQLVMGLALERLGRYPEAIEAYRRSHELDPFSLHPLYNWMWALVALRRPVEYAPLAERFLAVGGAESTRGAAADLATFRFRLSGELPADLKNFPADAQIGWLLRARRWEEAQQRAEAALTRAGNNDAQRCDLLGAQAEAWRHMERGPDAEMAAQVALGLAEALAAKDPERHTLRAILALSGAGHTKEAIQAAREFVQNEPRKNYPIARWRRELTLARVLARAGQTRESVALIRHLLAEPSDLTVPMLRVEFDWDNLRDDPEFKALLADPKNSAPM